MKCLDFRCGFNKFYFMRMPGLLISALFHDKPQCKTKMNRNKNTRKYTYVKVYAMPRWQPLKYYIQMANFLVSSLHTTITNFITKKKKKTIFVVVVVAFHLILAHLDSCNSFWLLEWRHHACEIFNVNANSPFRFYSVFIYFIFDIWFIIIFV